MLLYSRNRMFSEALGDFLAIFRLVFNRFSPLPDTRVPAGA